MSKETNEPERVTPSTEKTEEPRREEARKRATEAGTWANLVRVRKNAKGG